MKTKTTKTTKTTTTKKAAPVSPFDRDAAALAEGRPTGTPAPKAPAKPAKKAAPLKLGTKMREVPVAHVGAAPADAWTIFAIRSLSDAELKAELLNKKNSADDLRELRNETARREQLAKSPEAQLAKARKQWDGGANIGDIEKAFGKEIATALGKQITAEVSGRKPTVASVKADTARLRAEGKVPPAKPEPAAKPAKGAKRAPAAKPAPAASKGAKGARPVCSKCGRDNGRPSAPDCRNAAACAKRVKGAA